MKKLKKKSLKGGCCFDSEGVSARSSQPLFKKNPVWVAGFSSSLTPSKYSFSTLPEAAGRLYINADIEKAQIIKENIGKLFNAE